MNRRQEDTAASSRTGAGTEDAMSSTLREARHAYFEAAGLPADGGYGARFVAVRFAGIPLGFPNTAGRVRAVRYHDLHHVLTGYRTDWVGEAEIAAWEVAGGCREFLAAWVLNLFAFFAGLVIAPVRTFRAFSSGRHARNLYGVALDEPLLERGLLEMRRELGLDVPVPALAVADVLSFAAWSGAAVALAALPILAIGVGLFAGANLLADWLS